MASSGLQLLGFFLSLVGLAATVAATLMVQWKQEPRGRSTIYEGLWMSCKESDTTECEYYDSILKLPDEIQAIRVVMPLSIFLSTMALIVSILGMKCTRFMDGNAKSKSTTAMIGGIMFMISGLMSFIATSLYVKMIVQNFNESHPLQSDEFGMAVFVSWAGGLLTVAGGSFLSCRRCSRSSSSSSSESMSSNHLITTTHPKSNYV